MPNSNDVSLPDFVDLLGRARNGDEHAFAVLFRLTQPRLLRFLGVIAHASADDIAAETWVSVVKDLDRFDGQHLSDFQAWVTTIARRRWIDEVRRRTRRPETVTDTVPERTQISADETEVIAGDDAAVAMLRLLSPEQAEVVALRVVLGLDVEMTAEIVGRTPGAVRVMAHRGLKRLAQLVPPPPDTKPAAATDSSAGAINE